MPKRKEDIAFCLRLPPKLHKALSEAAARDMRSLNSEIIFLCARGLGISLSEQSPRKPRRRAR